MNTEPIASHTANLSLAGLLAAALLMAPLSQAQTGDIGSRAEMTAFLATTTPLGLGPFNQTEIAFNQIVDANGDPIRWLTLGFADEPLYTRDIFSAGPFERLDVLSSVLVPDAATSRRPTGGRPAAKPGSVACRRAPATTSSSTVWYRTGSIPSGTSRRPAPAAWPRTRPTTSTMCSWPRPMAAPRSRC